MGTEQLENALGYLYRDLGSIQRIAENAGLDVSRLALERTTPVTAWHNVLVEAEQQLRIAEIYAIVRKEHPRTAGLAEAWAAYEAGEGEAGKTATPARGPVKRPPRGQAGNHLSDQYRDARMDQMQRDQATQGAQIAALVVQVSNLTSNVTALTELLRKQSEHDAPPLNNRQFGVIMLAFVAIALLVFVAVYYGGNR